MFAERSSGKPRLWLVAEGGTASLDGTFELRAFADLGELAAAMAHADVLPDLVLAGDVGLLAAALSHRPLMLPGSGYTLNVVGRAIEHRGARLLELTPREVQIMALLVKGSAKREELVAQVWRNVRVSAKTVDVHLSNLRRKLRRVGYGVRMLKSGVVELMRVP